jgi:fused signal recognition particle receptor
MFGFKKNKSASETRGETPAETLPQEAPGEPIPATGFFARLKTQLTRTRQGLTEGLANLVLGKKQIDAEVLEDLETRLLSADVGVEATQAIIANLTARVARKQLDDTDALFAALRENMLAILNPVSQPLMISDNRRPFVMLMVGINGAGKTTTIGKLAKRLQGQGHSVVLAAGDTFRAAAVEQLQVWGERNNIAVIAQRANSQGGNADPASVAFDAVQAAQARGLDVLLVDTAGRLHTQTNLMEELKKVKRVIAKLDTTAPHEIMLVVDASIGQNALNQAQQFHQAVGLTGITLTKLDGTAKGGIVFAIAQKTGLPIRYIGVGEGIDDLREFNAAEFVDALLGQQPPGKND